MPARPRPAGTAPWTRGPLLLAREPMALLAVVAAAALLGVVVAAGPLFASSVGTAALHAAAARQCVQDDRISLINPSLDVYGTVEAGPQGAKDVAAADPAVRKEFARQGLPSPTLTTYTVVPTTGATAVGGPELGLFASPGALQHVRVLGRVPGDGVFLPDTYAGPHGLRPGGRLPVGAGSVRIAGVYADLDTAGYRTVLPAFWCHWRDLIITSVSSRPPPFVLADPATVAALGADIQAEWTSPTDIDRLTVAGARRLAAAGRALVAPGDGYTERTSLDANVQLTSTLQAAVTTPVLAIAAAAAVLALVVVGGAVVLWTQRRRAELALLAARGVGPGALGLKAVAELGLPAAAGCALGWAAGIAAVPWIGPSPLTEPGARLRALLAVGVAWAVGLAAVLLVAAAVLGERRARSARAVRWAPPSAVVVLLGVSAWLFAGAARRQPVLPGVYRIDPALLLAPLLGLTGLVLAAALLAVAPLQRVRGPAGRWRVPAFAALNRAAAARPVAVVVLCGLAVPVGLALYSAGFTASTAATVTAKAHVYLGAPVVLDLRVQPKGLPRPDGATPVSYALAEATGPGEDDEVEVLGVDPRSFARFAFHDDELTGAPLADLLGQLHAPSPDGPAPALLVGAGGGPSPTQLRVRDSTLAVDVVRTVPAFPGIRTPYRAAVVVDLAAVAGMDPFGHWTNELWTDQAHVDGVLAGLSRRHILTDAVQRPDTFVDATALQAVTWTFAFLRWVSVAVAVVSAGGLLLFLSARQQRQQAAFVLMRRMGMSAGAYRRSLLLELAVLTGWAWLSGVVTGGLALLVATRAIDVQPGFLPPTLLRLPLATAGWTALGLGCVTVVLTGATLWQAARAQPAAVLRG